MTPNKTAVCTCPQKYEPKGLGCRLILPDFAFCGQKTLYKCDCPEDYPLSFTDICIQNDLDLSETILVN